MSLPRVALWTILLVALAGVIGYRMNVFREPPPPAPVKIAFVTCGPGAYWQMAISGAKAAAGKNAVELVVLEPASAENVAQQTELLKNLKLAELDGVALSPLDAAGQTPLIDEMMKQTNVVTFDSDAPDSKRLSHIGTSNFTAGLTCARLVNEALPDGGKIAVLLANLTKENLLDRKAGFVDRIAEYVDDTENPTEEVKFVVVEYLVDDGDLKRTEENIRSTLDKHADLNCFVGLNAFHAPVLLKVLGDEGQLGKIKLVTFDIADETLDGVENGYIYATLAQDPYRFGYDAIKSLATICRGGDIVVPIVGRGSLYVPAEPIYQHNVSDFRARLKARQEASQPRTAKKDAA